MRGDWAYWIERWGRDPSKPNLVIALLKNQLSLCLHCGLHFMSDDHLETQYRNGNHEDNTLANLVLLDNHCYEVHLTEPFGINMHPHSFYSQYLFEVFRDTPLLSEIANSGQKIHQGFSR